MNTSNANNNVRYFEQDWYRYDSKYSTSSDLTSSLSEWMDNELENSDFSEAEESDLAWLLANANENDDWEVITDTYKAATHGKTKEEKMSNKINLSNAHTNGRFFVLMGNTLLPRADIQSWEKKELINSLTKPAFKHFFPEGTVDYLGYSFSQGEELS